LASKKVLLKRSGPSAIAILQPFLDIVHQSWYNEGMHVIQTVTEKEIKPILEMIITTIRKHVTKKYSILLFGSWAQSVAIPASDIDIAINGPERIDSLVMARILQDIEDLPTLRKIDIVDVHAADKKFRERILNKAVVID
jgi:predicted nucleotidyltransferase